MAGECECWQTLQPCTCGKGLRIDPTQYAGIPDAEVRRYAASLEVPAKRSRGRPAIGAPLTVRLPDDVRHAITAEAERQDIAEAEVVRRIVIAWATARH